LQEKVTRPAETPQYGVPATQCHDGAGRLHDL